MNKIKRWMHLLRISWLMLRIRKAKGDATLHAARQALSAQLADGRGLPMKIGQMLAGMDDHSVYQPLTQSIQPWQLDDMLPVLEQAWGQPFDQVLASIEESQAAASLGQVHQAMGQDGLKLAIKLQYPDIRQAIDAEMHLAGLVPRGGPIKRWDFDLDAYKSTLKQNMLHELDYMHEKEQQLAFQEGIDVEGLYVPTIIHGLCRPNVLVQTWAEGQRLSVAKDWGQLPRLHIAKILMKTMFQSLFQLGLVHGDPHPGNMLFQKNGDKASMTLLDFGCMVKVEERRRLALLQLILSSRGECHVDPVAGFVALGFDEAKLNMMKTKLAPLMQIIFRPFIEEKPFDLTHWHPGQEAEALLGDQRWIFRAAGPADLFLIMRVFQGLVQQLIALNIQLPWWSILQQAISEDVFNKTKLNTLNAALPMQEAAFMGTAQTLHIRVLEAGREKVHVRLPAASALQLRDLMPEEARKVLKSERVSLDTIENNLREQGVNPQVLIDIKSQQKHYHLWLE